MSRSRFFPPPKGLAYLLTKRNFTNHVFHFHIEDGVDGGKQFLLP